MKTNQRHFHLRGDIQSSAFALVIVCLSGATASASTWNVDAGGSWDTVGSWSGGVPNAPGGGFFSVKVLE
jgi:hypothetical protein